MVLGVQYSLLILSWHEEEEEGYLWRVNKGLLVICACLEG